MTYDDWKLETPEDEAERVLEERDPDLAYDEMRDSLMERDFD
jgi:hypothetical protein